MKKFLYFSLTALLILAVALSGCGGGGGGNKGGGVTVTTVAGGGWSGYDSGDVVDVTGPEALFNGPEGIAIADGIIYVSDLWNNKIKMIEPASNYRVTTIAGNFNYPKGIAIAANGNIYVADMWNQKIRMISATAEHSVSTIAGSGTAGSADNATGTNATFDYPYEIALAADGIYVTDSNKIRKIGLASPYPVSSLTIDGGYALSDPTGIIVTTNCIYVASSNRSRIHKLVPSGTPLGYVNSTLAGGGADGITSGNTDGIGVNALFDSPYGMALAADGSIYVADHDNNKIRKINPVTGQVTTIAGGGADGKTSGIIDGKGTAALFNNPSGIAIAADGSLYVADSGNNKIRRISFK